MSNQEFVLAILFICVGIPVISGSIVSLIHGPKDKKRKKYKDDDLNSQKDREMLEEIYYGLGDLDKRIKNLETILEDKGE